MNGRGGMLESASYKCFAFSPILSPSEPPLFPHCCGCGTVITQLTHSLISIPFCSCTNLLLLLARNVLSHQLLLTCSASQPSEESWRAKNCLCSHCCGERERAMYRNKEMWHGEKPGEGLSVVTAAPSTPAGSLAAAESCACRRQ